MRNRKGHQVFECEHCGAVGEDVYHDDDFGGALCEKCIATKSEWLNEPDSETIDHDKIKECVSVFTQVLVFRAKKITRESIIEVVTQFNVVYELSHIEWTLVVGTLDERFV